MNVKISLESDESDDAIDNITNLKTRLTENLDDDAEIKQGTETLQADDAGAGVLAALLNVVVGKEFINGIVEVIKEWVKSRPAIQDSKKTKLKIVVEHENGKKTSIELENLKDLTQLKELTDSL